MLHPTGLDYDLIQVGDSELFAFELVGYIKGNGSNETTVSFITPKLIRAYEAAGVVRNLGLGFPLTSDVFASRGISLYPQG